MITWSEENFVRINRSEIVNLNAVDGFEGNCYYVGKNPLYATGDYRQRMESVFVKAKQQWRGITGTGFWFFLQ